MSYIVEKALLIDDSEIDLFIQRRFLEVFNFSKQLMTYSSARQALDWLKTEPSENLPKVIFLDLNMPDMDGFGFLLALSELPDGVRNRLQIVILTSSNSLQDLNNALAFKNVIHFITKPLKQTDMDNIKLKLANK